MSTPTIMNRILDRGNLSHAFKEVNRNKSATDVDGMTIDELGDYMSENKTDARQ